MCEVIACYNCYVANEWGGNSYCATCLLSNKRKLVNSAPFSSSAKKAKCATKFEQRCFFKVAEIKAEKRRPAKKQTQLPSKLKCESKIEVLSKKKAKQQARTNAKYRETQHQDAAALAVYSARPMTMFELWC